MKTMFLRRSTATSVRAFAAALLAWCACCIAGVNPLAPAAHAASARPSLMEKIDRGVVVVRTTTTEAFISWRLLGTEVSDDPAFNIYRITDGGAPVKLNAAPLTQGTNFTDTTADFTRKNTWHVRALAADGSDLPAGDTVSDSRTETSTNTLAAGAPVRPYLRIPMNIPPGGTTPAGETYTYSPNDCSVGDLDGDGEYELIVKWGPSNAKDNAQSGYTGNVYIDAYKLDGTRLWRIDLGKNIRAGEHYTQFLVYDFDGDGKAELVCKTGDGTIDGAGVVIGNAAADYRNSNGYILSGPEYLTVFNGATGAALATTRYLPHRDPDASTQSAQDNPATSRINTVWGDNYGNRIDRFLACVAYLDGQRPSIVMCRGYYTRTFLVAWDWRDGQLTQRWIFDSATPGNANYAGQGNHNLSVADVDGDGCDEIIYGQCTINNDGTGLYTTRLGHGDKMHVARMNPAKDQLLFWGSHEDTKNNGGIGQSLRDAKTGAVLFTIPATSDSDGAMAADIDPRSPGYEIWGAVSNIRSSITFEQIVPVKPSMTFAIWWDGDLLREILTGNRISKWNWNTNSLTTLLEDPGVKAINGSKQCLSGDILGDWREELILPELDNSALRIYIPTAPTSHRIHTLMHDRMYRLAIAWQNVCYNQAPHPGFYLGHDMPPPPVPNIVTSLDELLGPPAPAITAIQPDTGFSSTDFITSARNITLQGSAEPNVTVNLTLVTEGITRSTLADFAGNWTLNFTDITLPEGKSRFTATATGISGYTGARSQPRDITIMFTPPPAPAIMTITNDGATCAITGAAQPGCLVTISVTGLGDLATVQTGDDGLWTFSCPAASLPAPGGTFTANAVDEAGNAAVAPSSPVTINTTIPPPVITGIANDTGASNTDGITNDNNVTLRGTATAGDTITIFIIGASAPIGTTTADAGGAWSLACGGAGGLADGQYAFSANATRGASGASFDAPAFAVTVDTTPPTATIALPDTGAGSAVIFNVSFSEEITGASAASFTPIFTGGLTGAITDVTVFNNTFLAVTVGSITGDGTVRLDLNTASSGITDLAGNALAGGTISSQTVARQSNGNGVWLTETPGGRWSDAGNWLGGTIPNGPGQTADFSAIAPSQDNTAIMDTSGTVGKIIFGDTDPSIPINWSLVPSGGGAPGIRLAVASGVAEINVSGLALDAQATIAVPLAGTQGLDKTGASTLVLTGSNALSGALTVRAGDMRIGEGGVLNIGNNVITTASSSRLIVSGGTLQTTSRMDNNPFGGLIVEAGLALISNFRFSSADSSYLIVTGGTLIASDINLRRNGAETPSYTSGFIVQGGRVEAGSVAIGTVNSSGAISVEGGSVLVTGAFTIGNQTSTGRTSGIRVTGGKLVSTETTNGLILSRANGSNANTPAIATFSGGDATFEKITLGYDATVNSGSATITIDGGALHLGSGGIVKNGDAALTTRVTLASGTLGAKAAWTTSHPLALTGPITIRAADTTGAAADITLTGPITGAGGITKTGAGTLALSGTNTFTGPSAINEGTLAPTGTHAKFAALTWDSAATLALDLSRGDRLVLTGALAKTGAAPRQIVLANTGPLAIGDTRTLATFGSTTLTPADFAPVSLPGNLSGNITISGATLLMTVATAPDAPPAFITNPSNTSTSAGQGATFIAAANGNPAPAYQWQTSTDGATWTNLLATAHYAGVTTGTLTITAATAAMDGAQYRCVATNPQGSANSAPATLTIAIAPMIEWAAGAGSQTVMEGAPATFAINLTAGTAPLAYAWTKNGVPIAGATTATHTTPATTMADNGAIFRIQVVNSAGTAALNAALTVTINPDLRAQELKTLLETPGVATITINGPVDLSLAGGATLTSGKTIIGADASSTISGGLTIPSGASDIVILGVNFTAGPLAINGATDVQISHCTFTDAPVSITGGSDNIALSWNTFSATPAGVAGGGSAMTISSAGATTGILLHHNLWDASLKTDMPAVTNARVHMFNNYLAATGNTTATIAGAGAQILSVNNIYQGVNNPLVTQPGGFLCAHGNFMNATTGTTAPGADPVFVPPYEHLMHSAGIDAPGAAALSQLITSHAGNTDGENSITPPMPDIAARINASATAPGATITAGAAIVPSTSGFTLTSVAAGFSPAARQWYRNNTAIPAATAATFAVTSASAPDHDGAYAIALAAPTGEIAVSAAFTVTVGELAPPVIITHPESQTVTVGSGATFIVFATGVNIACQWRKDGADIPGATNASYTMNNVQQTAAGAYTVRVSNAAGSVTSAPATLTVNPVPTAPVITTHPAPQTAGTGDSVTFTVAATGNNLTYQWRKNGAGLAGGNSPTFTITSAQKSDAGNYTVRISNEAGAVISHGATLTVTTGGGGGGGGGGAPTPWYLLALALAAALRRLQQRPQNYSNAHSN